MGEAVTKQQALDALDCINSYEYTHCREVIRAFIESQPVHVPNICDERAAAVKALTDKPIDWWKVCGDAAKFAPDSDEVWFVGSEGFILGWQARALLAAAPAPAHDRALMEQIAQQWDGCMYDAPGESIDIGKAIRFAWSHRATPPKASAPAAVTAMGYSSASACGCSSHGTYGGEHHEHKCPAHNDPAAVAQKQDQKTSESAPQGEREARAGVGSQVYWRSNPHVCTCITLDGKRWYREDAPEIQAGRASIAADVPAGWKIGPTQLDDELSIVPPMVMKDGQMIQPPGICVASWSTCHDSRVLYALAAAIREPDQAGGEG